MASLVPPKYGSVAHESEDDFVFVTMSHPGETRNRNNQRVIRRRVMRDIGRSRRTRKRHPLEVTFGLKETVMFESADSTTDGVQIPTSLASWPFPVELNSRTKELVSFSMSISSCKLNSILTHISEL